MADQLALTGVLVDFAHTLVRRYEVGDVLHRLGDGVVEVLGVGGAGVSLADASGRLRFVSATDDATAGIEQAQDEFQEGPCGDAFRGNAPVLVPDLAASDAWPRFRPVAVQAGVRAAGGIPMRAEGGPIGALDLYSAEPRDWSMQDREAAQLLADIATSYVTNATELQRSRTLAAQLQHALDSRVVIEQAKGIIAERHGVHPDAAFQLLRDRARRTGARIHAVARHVVDGTGST